MQFGGWYGIAATTLAHASRDDDPRCMKVLCLEAHMACDLAESNAKNDRQLVMARLLSESIQQVEDIAAQAPPLPVPHVHDGSCAVIE